MQLMPQKKNTPAHYRKVHIFGIPITNIEPEEINDAIDECIESEEPSQIVFLSWWNLIRAICKWDYRAVVRNATMVIPTSPLVTLGPRILRGTKLQYYSEFAFTIRLLSRIEAYGNSVYLLGMEMEHVQEAERNITNTFPNLMIIGRYSGYFSGQQEQTVITAIRKANTTLLLAGDGVPNKEVWLYRVKHKVKARISLWAGATMDVLATKAQRLPDGTARRTFHLALRLAKRPWRIYRFFVFLFYFFALWYAKARHK